MLLAAKPQHLAASGILKRFHSYCGLIKIARCGFLRGKTAATAFASIYSYCEPL
jgi:hypothetical protein